MARDFRQVEGVDYFETFAPTPASSCVRLLPSTAYERNLDLCHFDAEQMFVQSDLEKNVSMWLFAWMVWTVDCVKWDPSFKGFSSF